MKVKSSDALLGKEEWIVVIIPYSEKTFIIYKWMQCLERTAGCKLLFFHKVLHFLCIRNMLHNLHTASQSLIKILCLANGCLPVGLEISAVVCESSAVCSDSDESTQLREFLCDVFWSL